MKHILFLLTLLITFRSYTQTNVIINNTLTIPHGDITLYLDNDTTTLASKHVITYKNFKNKGTYDRCNCWFQEVYKGKYIQSRFAKTGFDIAEANNTDKNIAIIPTNDTFLIVFIFLFYC